MIKLVLFDYGNVIIADTEVAFERFFGLKNLPGAAQKKYQRAYDLAESGKKPTSFLLKTMKQTFELPYSEKQIEQMIIQTALNKPVWDLFLAIKESGKYRIGIFTNNQKTWPEREARHVGIDLKGIPIFNSAKMGVKKPLPGAYKYVQKKAGVKPEEIVFVDDKKKNIEAAKRAGWKAIHFTGDMHALVRALKKVGVEVKIKRK